MLYPGCKDKKAKRCSDLSSCYKCTLPVTQFPSSSHCLPMVLPQSCQTFNTWGFGKIVNSQISPSLSPLWYLQAVLAMRDLEAPKGPQLRLQKLCLPAFSLAETGSHPCTLLFLLGASTLSCPPTFPLNEFLSLRRILPASEECDPFCCG